MENPLQPDKHVSLPNIFIPLPLEIREGQILDLDSPKGREAFDPLKIIKESRRAMDRMPNKRRGIVFGSGQNTPSWKAKGWLTQDINPNCQPNYVCDAGHLSEFVPSGSFDFVLIEYLSQRDQFFQQAAAILKPGGRLIVKTGHHTDNPDIPMEIRNDVQSGHYRLAEHLASSNQPHREQVISSIEKKRGMLGQRFRNLGFFTIAIHGRFYIDSSGLTRQQVDYYCEKASAFPG